MLKRILCLLFGGMLLIGVVMTLINCSPPDDDGWSGCPTCNDIVTWSSYGSYQLRNSGTDLTARDIIASCGWHVHNDHDGGYGDTLQIAACYDQECFPDTENPFTTNIVRDYCITASYIHFLPLQATGNTENETIDNDEPNLSCAYAHGHSVWYYFEAVEDGYVAVNTTGSDYDTVVAVFTGTCLDLMQVGCDDDSGPGSTSEVVIPVFVGETYYILVGSYGGAGTGGNLILNAIFQECAHAMSDEGVILVWAYNIFYGFQVREGWSGSTAEGIVIGSTLQEFLSTYSYFVEESSNIYVYQGNSTSVRATFDQDERLEKLYVGYYLRN